MGHRTSERRAWISEPCVTKPGRPREPSPWPHTARKVTPNPGIRKWNSGRIRRARAGPERAFGEPRRVRILPSPDPVSGRGREGRDGGLLPRAPWPRPWGSCTPVRASPQRARRLLAEGPEPPREATAVYIYRRPPRGGRRGCGPAPVKPPPPAPDLPGRPAGARGGRPAAGDRRIPCRLDLARRAGAPLPPLP